MKIKVFISFFLVFLGTMTRLSAQTELINATPLSPNAAALAKYIESPTGSFTGVPPISLPLFNIKASDIQIGISMSYHAGGNRVETVGSWVGLGWSLTGIPSISRQIKDIADEGVGGFFFKPAPTQTVKYISDNRDYSPGNFYDLLSRALDDAIDTEPDIFSFNLQGESGKFFYNQATESFNTFPKSNIKIIRTGSPYASFVITDEQGITYYFDVLENSISQGSTSNPNPPTTSTWYPSKIISSTGKDTVFFEYTTENQVTRNNFGSTFLIPLHLDGDLLAWCSEVNGNSEYTNNFASTYTTAKLPSRISYSLGSVSFEKNTTVREDLEGGYTLNKLVWKDYANKVAKSYEFYFSYLSGGPVSDAMYSVSTSKERKYLLLDSLVEKGGTLSNKYAFQYNRQNVPASRISAAQDEWGYYNGKILNNTLRPRVYPRTFGLDGAPSNLLTGGADRAIDTVYNQFGILQSILYPTGGKTEYKFESNHAAQVSEGQLMGYYKDQFAAIEVADGQTVTWPTTAVYQTYFTVGNPKDKILNNNNNNGGAIVKIDAGYFGCDLTSGSSACAQVAIRSVSGTPTTINMPISANKPNNTTDLEVYLPNGIYKLEASFNQDPPQYENFYITAAWKSLDSAMIGRDPLVGGLRIKKISHFTSAGDTEPALETEYRYTMGLNATKTSGEIFSSYSPIYSKIVETSKGNYQQITASPAFQTVLESGSCVGYKKVLSFVNSKDHTEQSATEMGFITHPDETNTLPPFVTLQNNEISRGKVDTIRTYTIKNGVARKVTEKVYEYEYMDTVTQKPYSFVVDHYRVGQKTGDVPTPWGTGLVIYNWLYYYPTYTFLLKKEKERTYNSGDGSTFLETVKEYSHNSNYFHVTKENQLLSDLSVKEVVYTRPYDLRLSETYYQQLVDKNQVGRIVKTEEFNNAISTEMTQIKYNNFSGMTLPFEVYKRTKSFPAEKVLEFNQYDGKGNILDQRKANDVNECYIWDHNQSLVIAKVINAAPGKIAYTSFEADGFGGWTIHPGSTISTNGGITGKNAFSGVIQRAVPAGDYIFSCWSIWYVSVRVNGVNGAPGRRVGEWEYREWKLSNVNFVEVAADGIDEARLYPLGAMITTYTYDPLIGLTSQCDAANRITYYEYDGLNRLLRVRDENRNILKQYDYQYQTVAHSNAIWQATGAIRCKPCPANASYTTNMSQNEERDTNPNSTTYNQTRWTDTGVPGSCSITAYWQNTGNVQCLTDGNGYRTGIQRVEKKDQNPCSPTYNQLQYQDISNTATCPPNAPNWQTTGNTRCKPCPANALYTTNILQNEERDTNPNSSTYNQTRWIDTGSQGACTAPAAWTNTATAVRCRQVSGQNTGEQEQEQRDLNPCSATYNQTRWIIVGTSTTACPAPPTCNSTTCSGVDKRCVNGICETGIKVYTTAVQNGPLQWTCYYHYEWSDGFWSATYSEISSYTCVEEEPGL